MGRYGTIGVTVELPSRPPAPPANPHSQAKIRSRFRKVLMRSRFILCFLAVLLLAGCANQKSTPAPTPNGLPAKYDPKRDPNADLQIAMRLATSSHRRILLEVGGDWCIWCHILDNFFVQNPDVAEYLQQHYVLMKVNYSPENKNKAFLANYSSSTNTHTRLCWQAMDRLSMPRVPVRSKTATIMIGIKSTPS